MSRRKIVYMCQDCGYETPKWVGRCPGCGNWNTVVEEPVAAPDTRRAPAMSVFGGQKPVPISQVETEDAPRFSSGSSEFDRVVGDGLVPGSVLLTVGDPGVGKSSLMLQVCAHVASTGQKALYVTGEESTRQVRMRAGRLGTLDNRLYVVSETNLESISQHCQQVKPCLLIIDSIQTVYNPEIPSAPGSVSQIRECAMALLQLAKANLVTTVLVGHVTKEGGLAGPRVLEHIVDTVLYFEGNSNAQYRVLRAVKNRFGSTNEIGLFEMRGSGLRDVPDASSFFLSERPLDVSGSVVVATMEGTRPLLVELQALTIPAMFGTPRRTADGIDQKRVQLVAAVLEKRAGVLLQNHDAYVKIAGGLGVDEPAVDLGLAVALVSSFRDTTLRAQVVVFGEVGLAGEVRAVTHAEQRIREAAKMGFKSVVMPKRNLKGLGSRDGVDLTGVDNICEALNVLL